VTDDETVWISDNTTTLGRTRTFHTDPECRNFPATPRPVSRESLRDADYLCTWCSGDAPERVEQNHEYHDRLLEADPSEVDL
jgi:hypothetical protein